MDEEEGEAMEKGVVVEGATIFPNTKTNANYKPASFDMVVVQLSNNFLGTDVVLCDEGWPLELEFAPEDNGKESLPTASWFKQAR